ncbi:hypothetical protein RS130_11915 [Paraglaciecola aquimarina]|uniref:Dicarboxylate transport domain-containing protein n=1 Tax=Paraglaciecola aquimarina TaxID=1235557 RepID=A0ABU3SX11_9ALTE|nr:hypothetical protein [Paraglaciecola aquimarina]MDU0354546.1 hypothetical protein [Paraglaciecola aquimarina]
MTIILMLFVLLVTPWGMQLAVSVADSSVDGLDVDYSSGGLLSELHLSDVRWEQAGTQATIKDLKLDLRLSCLFVAEVCIDAISTGRIDAKIVPAKEVVDSDSTPLDLVTMPMPISLNRIAIGPLAVSVEDQLDLSWQSLNAKLNFYQILVVEQFSIQNLQLTTYAAQATPPTQTQPQTKSKPFDFASIKYHPIQAMPITLPIHFQIKQFTLPDVQLNLAEQTPIKIDSVQLKASAGAKQIQLSKLLVEHAKGKVEVAGKLGLAGNLEHQLSFNAQGELNAFGEPLVKDALAAKQVTQVKLTSKGNIQNMTTDLNVIGLFEFSAHLQAQPAKETLPMDLKVTWQDLAWPLGAQDTPDFTSAKGNIELSGDLAKLNLAINALLSG